MVSAGKRDILYKNLTEQDLIARVVCISADRLSCDPNLSICILLLDRETTGEILSKTSGSVNRELRGLAICADRILC